MALNALLEEIVTNHEAASPKELTELLLDELPVVDYRETLSTVLPVYIRQWLSERRVWREPTVEKEETFAPDDLLSDDGQKVQRRLLKARGSARVNSIRNEWQRHYDDSLWNGVKYIKFGDATADDLIGAAESLRVAAKAEFEGKQAKAEYYEKIAAALPQGGRVRDLPDDPTRV